MKEASRYAWRMTIKKDLPYLVVVAIIIGVVVYFGVGFVAWVAK